MSQSNLRTLLKDFLNGALLTNQDLQLLMKNLYKIEQATSGMGDIFYATRTLASTQLDRVKSICTSRGINDDPRQDACPHCFRKLDIPEVVFRNIESYGNSSLVSTPCCAKPVRVSGSMEFRILSTSTEQDEDNWGTPFKK